MGVVGQSEYSIDFSEQSSREAREELLWRDRLRKKIFYKINKRNKEIAEHWSELPKSLQKTLRLMSDHVMDLDHESRSYGATQMYDYISNNLPNLLHKITLRIFKQMKVKAAKEIMLEVREFAMFTLLREGKLNNKQQKDIAKMWGGSPSDWSRIKRSDYARSLENALHSIIEFKKKKADGSENNGGTNPVDVENSQVHFAGTSTHSERELQDAGLVIKPIDEFTDIELTTSKAEDWAIAKRILKDDKSGKAEAKAIEFLKQQGHKKPSIEKFRREMILKNK
jgi:hypothetical protein